jgi:hypothetical protein
VASFDVKYGERNRFRFFSAVDGCLLSYDGKTLYRVANVAESVKVPAGVATIESEAFLDSRSLAKVTFPDSVRAIRASFAGCGSLKSVVFEGSLAPEVDASFEGFGKKCAIVVPAGSKGWGTKIPGVWHGSRISYPPRGNQN